MTKKDIETRQVQFSTGVFEYELITKKVKNINLRINREGNVTVSANKRVDRAYVDNFVIANEERILSAKNRLIQKPKYASDQPKEFVDFEKFYILGRQYELKVVQSDFESVKIVDNNIILSVKDISNYKAKEKLYKAWSKEMQVDVFNKVSLQIYEIFKQYNIDYPEIKIRSMKSRWGSCQPQNKIITLNSKLIETPIQCIEYVVLHEYAHFIHQNHSKEFYNFVQSLMPDYKARKLELNAKE